MTNANGGTIVVNIKGQDIGLTDLLNRINQQMLSSTGTIRNYGTVMSELDPKTRKADAALRTYASSLANLLAKQGDFAGAQKVLITALQGITPATTNANNVLSQLVGIQDQAAKASQQQTSGLSTLTQSLVSLRIGFQAVSQVAKIFGDAINSGNELEKTLTTFRVLSGSSTQYATNLSLARAEQAKFGGSLNDTVDGMSSFANLSNRTGVEIDKLTRLARALATVDPAQGFKGAGIALKEFFSGDITSLARRFEIPRSVLNDLKNITDEKERFDALTAALEKFGISEELVDAQAKTVATSFAKLSGNAEDSKAVIGQFLGQLAQPVVEQFARQLADMNAGFERLKFITDGTKTALAENQLVFAKTDSFDQYTAKINEINNALPPFATQLRALTPEQYAFAQSLIQAGSSAEQAFNKVQQFQGLLDKSSDLFNRSIFTYDASAQSLNAFAAAQLQAANTSDAASAAAIGYAQAVASGGITLEEAIQLLTAYTAQAQTKIAPDQAATEAQNLLTSATDLFSQATVQATAEQIVQQSASEATKITHEQLYAAALAAAQGMGATAGAAQQLAGQFGITTASAYDLIAALSQLEVAKAKQALGVQPGGANEREDRLGSNADIIQRAKDLKLRQDLAKVQLENARAAANATGKLAIERDELAKLTKGTVEYETQLGRVQAAERAVEAEKKKKGGGAPKLTPNEKINTKLLDDLDKYNNKFEDAEQKHYDKLAEIYEDYAKKQAEQVAKNEVSTRRSRADFYTGLQDAAKNGIDPNVFAAQYEEAFAKAQEIAQSGKAKLANEFLELRQKQIEEMQKLAEEEAQIREDRKSGKIDKATADAELAYLEGRKKLIQDAQDEEQKQLLAAGDENQNRLQEQLDAENKAYADQTEKISTASERAAEAKIKHAERSKIAVSEENIELAKQAAYYDRIAARNGGQIPNSARPTTTGGNQPLPADTTQTKPINVEQTKPVAIDNAEALVVRQAELFVVQDVDVYNIISDVGTRLETRLGQVIESINGARDSISNAVKSVENAVGRIRVSNSPVQG